MSPAPTHTGNRGGDERGDTDRVSIGDLLETAVDLSWHEAVAVAQELCDAVPEGDRPMVFHRDTTFIDASGELTSTTPDEGAPGESVNAVGELLRSWLMGVPHPMPLGQVVSQAISSPPLYATLRELSEALKPFDSPSHSRLMRGVFERGQRARAMLEFAREPSPAVVQPPRAKLHVLPVTPRAIEEPPPSEVPAKLEDAAAPAESRGPAESPAPTASVLTFERLVPEFEFESTVSSSEPNVWADRWKALGDAARDRTPKIWNEVRAHWNPRVAAIAGTILLAAALAGLFGPALARSMSRGGVEARQATSSLTRASETVLNTLGAWLGDALNLAGTGYVQQASAENLTQDTFQEPPTGQRVADVVLPRRGIRPRLLETEPSSNEADAQQRSLDIPAKEIAETSSPMILSALSRAPGADAAAAPGQSERVVVDDFGEEGFVYTASDTDVRPPVPIYPTLPSTYPPGVTEEDVTFLEIVIDEGGLVEFVRATHAPTTLNRAMVAMTNLSALKTWRFVPAQKNGRPVKYRRTVWVETH